MNDRPESKDKFRIAVVGSGISGLAATWLLSQHHDVTLFESDLRLGGHSNTVRVIDTGGQIVSIDTGFIVYNEATYPNLQALFRHLSLTTHETTMGFSVSMGNGALEYSGNGISGLFAQKRNIFRTRFWNMLRDIIRFYHDAPLNAARYENTTLESYLDQRGYGEGFRDDHLYPMASAIWSTSVEEIGSYPVTSFVRFCENHRLLNLRNRPTWKTVVGGSHEYVRRLQHEIGPNIMTGNPVIRIKRDEKEVTVLCKDGSVERFDKIVIATHADDALKLLDAPSHEEEKLLGAFRYTNNRVLLHTDKRLMPIRRSIWSAWNYMGSVGSKKELCVSYWMNALQPITSSDQFFVTLNPFIEPESRLVHYETHYSHPLLNAAALSAQRELWRLQGKSHTWFSGAYFGSGFHEDGLQSGLAAAESIGGVRRPWNVNAESGRIFLAPGNGNL